MSPTGGGTFSHDDRNELTRQGFLLDQLGDNLDGMRKIIEKEVTNLERDQEKFEARLRRVEEVVSEFRGTIRATMLLAAAFSTLLGAIAHAVLSKLGL